METQPAQIYFVSPKGYAMVMLATSGELAFVPEHLMRRLSDGRSGGVVNVATTRGSKGPVVTSISPALGSDGVAIPRTSDPWPAAGA